MNNIDSVNVLALAYLGDAVYELYIRKYLLKTGLKVNDLQKESIKYVSAKAQSEILDKLLETDILSDEEINIIKRARNHKSHASPKSASVIEYKKSTGFEALIGYLELSNNKEKIKKIINYIVGE